MKIIVNGVVRKDRKSLEKIFADANFPVDYITAAELSSLHRPGILSRLSDIQENEGNDNDQAS